MAYSVTDLLNLLESLALQRNPNSYYKLFFSYLVGAFKKARNDKIFNDINKLVPDILSDIKSLFILKVKMNSINWSQWYSFSI